MSEAQVIVVTIGTENFEFTVTNREYNKFVDSMAGGKVTMGAYNLLSNTVKQEQHATLKSMLVDGNNNPKSTLVMEAVGVITEDFTSDLPKVVKTRASSANSSKETDLSNS
ncbi:putative phage tail assembly chaperone [Marinomonas posidonica]|uniref:putative phage tail assembly chaperone n=1 Tax=Marinomonas posidonica TaxID=936476 RepID=UPI0037370BE3